jgi:hypothetical protein
LKRIQIFLIINLEMSKNLCTFGILITNKHKTKQKMSKMKTILMTLIVAATIFSTSCQKEELNNYKTADLSYIGADTIKTYVNSQLVNGNTGYQVASGDDIVIESFSYDVKHTSLSLYIDGEIVRGNACLCDKLVLVYKVK